jgi:hypothetical protein
VELGKSHKKLKKAHSTLLEQNEKEHVVTCEKGLTCDMIDESFYKPIFVAPTNLSYSTFTSSSSSNDGFTCDASLMVENETLKKEINVLTCALGNAYGGEARLLKCLGRQRFSLNKEGLGYTSNKGKVAFATHKTRFMKGNGQFCNRCKQVGHVEQYCKNKNKDTNVFLIKFDSCYLIIKGVNGVHRLWA